MADRFCFTTDPELAVSGYYKHRRDGTLDLTTRYDAVPNDDGSHKFVKSERQYQQVGKPVQLEVVATARSTAEVRKPTIIERMLGK